MERFWYCNENFPRLLTAILYLWSSRARDSLQPGWEMNGNKRGDTCSRVQFTVRGNSPTTKCHLLVANPVSGFLVLKIILPRVPGRIEQNQENQLKFSSRFRVSVIGTPPFSVLHSIVIYRYCMVFFSQQIEALWQLCILSKSVSPTFPTVFAVLASLRPILLILAIFQTLFSSLLSLLWLSVISDHDLLKTQMLGSIF